MQSTGNKGGQRANYAEGTVANTVFLLSWNSNKCERARLNSKKKHVKTMLATPNKRNDKEERAKKRERKKCKMQLDLDTAIT